MTDHAAKRWTLPSSSTTVVGSGVKCNELLGDFGSSVATKLSDERYRLGRSSNPMVSDAHSSPTHARKIRRRNCGWAKLKFGFTPWHNPKICDPVGYARYLQRLLGTNQLRLSPPALWGMCSHRTTPSLTLGIVVGNESTYTHRNRYSATVSRCINIVKLVKIGRSSEFGILEINREITLTISSKSQYIV